MKTNWQYFKAQIIGDKIKTEGDRSCLFGYQYHLGGYPKPAGVWSRWDFKDDILTIENDCLGFCPIYYYCDDTKIVVSNSIIQIIAQTGDVGLDDYGLSMFLRRNYFLDDYTAYKNIKTLAPNSTVIWNKGKLSITQSFLEPLKPESLNHEQIVDGYIELTHQALKRHLPKEDNFIMPLSGGRDSRIMLLELLKNGFKPKICYTCGEQRDVKLATQVAQRLNLNHKVLDYNQRWVADAVRKNLRISFSTIQHDWLMSLGDVVRNGGLLSYDGNGVGMFSRNAFTDAGIKVFEYYRNGKYQELADFAFPPDNANEKYLQHLPKDFKFIFGDIQKLRQDYIDGFAKYDMYPNDLSAFSFYCNTRTAISTCPYGIMHPAKIYCPLLDYDLFRFVASLTPEQVLEKEPQAVAVRKAFPDLADIAFYNELKIEPYPKPSKFTKAANIADLLKFIYKFDRGIVSDTIKHKLSKPIDKDHTAHTKFTNLLLYLSMVKFCSKQKNAADMLNWLDNTENFEL